ncbi:hypothetical protein SAMN02910400_00481 [Lachnospiraceae bacterium C10]|jgi:DNA-binding protein WhiA|nr:DNA-binding protein WhiA [Lachnospiraceae bacterium]SCW35827.1 hypothetical protein SAMN02910400_00481 [Lachnospiraceae bacterium C10]SDW22647.1 hypothetical protein SAMN05216391_103114 [Lachnospiraceae bacterium KHCPX20]
MSFSSEVKKELIVITPKARHCQTAELSAMTGFLGKKDKKIDGEKIYIASDNTDISRKFFTLSKKTISISENGMEHPEEQQECCRKSYLRGAFLVAGSMSDPNKSYHFEIVCHELPQAKRVCDVMRTFDTDPHIVERKGHYVVYLKEGSQIATILGVMGAPKAYMELENIRILKDMRNSVNRQVNCEAANIHKTVSAAVRQAEDIACIENHGGLTQLPENLREAALLRLEYPDLSLEELGKRATPPIGKSGINHRLRRIGQIAERIRNQEDKS